MKKKHIRAVLAGILLVSQLAMPAATLDRTAAPAPTPASDQTARVSAVQLIPQDDGTHINYMSGDSQGLFQPEKPLTRSELAQMLYKIVADRPDTVPVLADVPLDAWYAPAVETVAGLGLMLSDGGTFRPGDPVTRAECAYALSQLLPYDAPLLDLFPDVWPAYWAYQAICRTTGQGLFLGDSTGNFRPEDSLRRCEAVAVFNRLLGRSPNLQNLAGQTNLRTFPDVPRTHWAYAEIMEATVTHQCAANTGSGEIWLPAEPGIEFGHEFGNEPEAPSAPVTTDAAGLPDGPQRIDGHLYWVVGEVFTRSCKMDGLAFDENGWYTTGDAELDDMLNNIVNELVDASMTRDEQLRVLYDYVVRNYKYLARPLVSKGTKGWETEYAKFFLKNGKGNCFSFAATYCLLCQELGLPAYTVVGTSGGSAHGWVEIFLDGSTYMFDPELQWYYNNRTSKKVNLFKMLPTRIPSGVYRYAW